MRKSMFFAIALVLATATANAQQYHRPYYTQRPLQQLATYPYFVENRTNGPLKVIFEVNGQLWPVEVDTANEVPDLMLPRGATVKVKSASVQVFEGRSTKWKDAKYYYYEREDSRNGPAKRGWLFY